MCLYYQFGFTMYRLNKSHEIREMIIVDFDLWIVL